jgi:hypothetical protein
LVRCDVGLPIACRSTVELQYVIRTLENNNAYIRIDEKESDYIVQGKETSICINWWRNIAICDRDGNNQYSVWYYATDSFEKVMTRVSRNNDTDFLLMDKDGFPFTAENYQDNIQLRETLKLYTINCSSKQYSKMNLLSLAMKRVNIIVDQRNMITFPELLNTLQQQKRIEGEIIQVGACCDYMEMHSTKKSELSKRIQQFQNEFIEATEESQDKWESLISTTVRDLSVDLSASRQDIIYKRVIDTIVYHFSQFFSLTLEVGSIMNLPTYKQLGKGTVDYTFDDYNTDGDQDHSEKLPFDFSLLTTVKTQEETIRRKRPVRKKSNTLPKKVETKRSKPIFQTIPWLS